MNSYERDKIIKFIFDYFGNDFMKKAKCKDDFINSVQVKGSEKVSKIALGVTANLELIEKAVEWGAEFIIVHHGIPLNCKNHTINNVLKQRLKIIFDNDISLMGLHYPLDAHPEIGNSAMILKKIGASIEKPFFDEWGWIGYLPETTEINNIMDIFTKIFKHKPISYLYGEKYIRKIAVASGGAVPDSCRIEELLDNKIDLYVSGECRESTPALMKESSMNYLAFGHYDTEKFGVLTLGQVIKEHFKTLQIKFIDIPNPF